uniref:Integrase catalytic domain-containing protein n=1 Tax=Tanacetum cinerariifolium TaxID=118510 RepID=A0A6L2NQ06_TANCI|nr:hypothetical protein [Tanacetum cinerariifolium]
MSEEDQSVDVAALPKFDMPSYKSSMSAKDVKSLAIRHGILLDLHHVAFTKGLTMDKLLDDMIGLYEQYFEFWGIRRHHDSDVNDPVPENGFSELDVQTLTEQVIDLLSVPSGLFFQGGLATTWDFPGFYLIFKDTEGNGNALSFYLYVQDHFSGTALTNQVRIGQHTTPPLLTDQPILDKTDRQKEDELATSGHILSSKPIRKVNPTAPVGENPSGSVAETAELQKDRSLHISPHDSANHSVPMLRKVSHPEGVLSTCPSGSFTGDVVTALERAWFSLTQGDLAQTNILERFEHLQDGYDKLAKTHSECEEMVQKLVAARAVEVRNDELSWVNKDQTLQIKKLDDELAKKDYALVYAERISTERAQEKEKLVTQLGRTKMENFDCIRRLLPIMIDHLLQSHKDKKSHSVSDLLKIYPDSPPFGQASAITTEAPTKTFIPLGQALTLIASCFSLDMYPMGYVMPLEGLHKGYDRFQRLLSQLEIHGAGVSTEDANQKFLSTNSTNEVSTAYDVSTSFGDNSQKEGSSSYTDDLIYSFFANQSSGPQLDHKDLEQVDEFDLEEMDLKWQDEHKAMVTIDGEGVDWTVHAKDDTEDYALMAFSSSNSGSDTEVTSCSKVWEESYAKLKKLYDEQREQFGVARIEIQAYTLALKKISAKDKSRLGYGNQIHEGVLSYENKVLESVFDSRSSDVEDSPVNDRFAKVKGMHAVPPPMKWNYMPPKSDFRIDESKFTFVSKKSKTSESDANTSDLDCCKSSSSVETLEYVPKPVESKTKVVNEPKVWSNAPIIEEYESDSDNEYVFKALIEQEKPNTECLVFSPDFKLLDENQVLLRIPRQNNMYSFNLENIIPSGGFACLIIKATVDESNKWHRRLGHVNFKNLNKLIKGNLVRGLPSKIFQNDHTCVACHKGKQHKASCKAKLVSSISQPLQLLHMDLFGPTSVRSINHKTYCLVITDDFSRSKGIKKECSNARTPQQNGVAERKNRTLIEATRTMLADSFLPNTFWVEAVSTACYVLNRVLVTKPQNKTPYELLTGKIPIISYIRPFGCHVTILNTIDHPGKFEEKFDEGFLVGYSLNSKAFSVYNLKTKRVEENMHINFLENKPNVAGKGPTWLFDLDYLTDSMNYLPVTVDNKANKTLEYYVLPLWSSYTSTVKSSKTKNGDEKLNGDTSLQTNKEPIDQEDQVFLEELERLKRQEKEANDAAETLRKTASYDDECVVADFTNLESIMNIEPKKISQVLEDESWVDAMQEELLQFKTRQVWILVDLPFGKKVIGTKWVYRNKKDERGVIVRNKARLVAQGHRQEEVIDHDEVFAPVARIEAISIFLAFASYMGFIVYQMDVKSAFLYEKIDEDVYVSQPPGSIDPKFQMSSMGELTFFLRLKVKQKEDGIFINQDKYVTEILKKFDFISVKTASSLIETKKPLVKDEEAADVDVHLYRSMIGSLIGSLGTSKANQLGLWYPKESVFDLEAYSDSDYAGENLDRKSTTGGMLIEKKLIQMLKIHTNDNVADLLTKAFDISSAKTTSRNEFSSTMASAIICLATDQKFNFSRIGKLESRVERLDEENKVLKKLKSVHSTVDANDPVMEKEKSFKQGRKIADIDADVEINLGKAQAKEYNLDLDNQEKVLSMLDVNDEEPADVEEVLEVVKSAKLITKVVTTARATKVSIPRKKKGVIEVARQLEPELNADINWNAVIEQVERSERLTGAVIKYQALKRKPLTEAQARRNMIVYLKNMVGQSLKERSKARKNVEVESSKREGESLEQEIAKKQKMEQKKIAKKQKMEQETEELKKYLQIVPNDDHDVYTDATSLASKIPIVDYKIHTERNIPYFKIIRADGNHMLFISFNKMMKIFDKEDLESLWKIIRKRFEKVEPKNYSDDYLLNTLKIMFEKPNVKASVSLRSKRQIWYSKCQKLEVD